MLSQSFAPFVILRGVRLLVFLLHGRPLRRLHQLKRLLHLLQVPQGAGQLAGSLLARGGGDIHIIEHIQLEKWEKE